jgi:hypothetical protein
VVNSAFRDALRSITGDSWLDDLARASLSAADAKFSADYVTPPILRVVFSGLRDVEARDSYLATKAVQDATAKLGHIIRNPQSETSMAHAADRAKAPLLLRSQSGNVIIFGFPLVEDGIPPGTLAGIVPETLAVQAARELVNVLPSSEDDDAALDAVLAQRPTVRNAVTDIVNAVPSRAAGLALRLTPGSGDPVNSVLSAEQASMLKESLKETRIGRRFVTISGRLDGVRTKRRIFYLELENGREIHGALNLESLDDIRTNLGRPVTVRLEEEQTESVSGRRSQPLYRLISIVSSAEVF